MPKSSAEEFPKRTRRSLGELADPHLLTFEEPLDPSNVRNVSFPLDIQEQLIL